MFNTKEAPMAKYSSQVQKGVEVNKVYKTSDLTIFKTLDGNRDVIQSHLKRLSKSMKDRKLFSPIIVNEKMEVIDGQHRLMASKNNNVAIEYIIVNGYGLKEVQILNANSKNWNSDDYMNGYCDLKNQEYIKYKDFKDTYGFGHSECQALLSNQISSNLQPVFNSGQFKIKDYKKAVDMAERITMISEFYNGYKRRSFVFALMALFNNDVFEFTQFIQKLKIQPTALVDCTTASAYLLLIEDIYNYKSRNKVSLRY
jgi:hypothetical protein